MPNHFLVATAASILLSALAPSIGHADVLFSTFGPGNSYAATGGVIVSGSSSPFTAFSEADEFTAAFSGQLTGLSVAVALGSNAQASAGFIDLELAPNNPANNLPLVAGVLNLGTVQATSNSPAILTLADPAVYAFVAGSAYWLILAPHTSATNTVWEAATNSAAAATAYMSATTGGQFAASSNPANAFEVAASVPEPSTWTLLGAGAATLMTWFRRRSGSPAWAESV